MNLEESSDAYLSLIDQLKDNSQGDDEDDFIFLTFVRLWVIKHAEGEAYEGI